MNMLGRPACYQRRPLLEASPAEKDKISHRAHAFAALKASLF